MTMNMELDSRDVLAARRKQVPIGTNFQAELPSLPSSDQFSAKESLDNHRWLGTRLWPPAEEPDPVASSDRIGKGRIGICVCNVRGSAHCVKQHIEEERKALKCELGKTFYDLGFDDMGECVSKRWMPAEESDFEELSRVHPSVLKTSFWDHLVVVFPSKSRREFVSYYFNVLVLRRRAMQNRYSPNNIDSDDDETMVIDSESNESTSYPDYEGGVSETEDDAIDGAMDDHLCSLTEDDNGQECIQNFYAANSKEEPKQLLKDLVAESSAMVLMTVAPQDKSFDSRASHCSDVQNSEKDLQAIQRWQEPIEHPLHHLRQQGSQTGMSYPSFFDDIQSGQNDLRCKEFCYDTEAEQSNLKCKEFCDDTRVKEDGFRCTPELFPFESKVWDCLTDISSPNHEKLISTNGMMREFFGDDG